MGEEGQKCVRIEHCVRKEQMLVKKKIKRILEEVGAFLTVTVPDRFWWLPMVFSIVAIAIAIIVLTVPKEQLLQLLGQLPKR